MKRRYILLLSALVLFTGAVIMTGCPANVKPQTPKYKVTLNSGKHGTVTVKPSLPADGMVEAHTRLSFTAQPDEGYEVDTWIMAAPRSADKKEAALTVAEKTTVTVTFKPKIKKYKIMLNKNEYGTVTVSPALPADGMVEQYKTLTFTAQPDEGYEVEWTGAAPDNADKNKATLTVTANAVVTATFKKPGNSSEVQNYHVALSSGSNGTLIADTPLPADGMVAAGSILTFTATPDSAYEVEAWTGAVANPSDSTKATLTVTAHTTVSVTFKEKQADVALLEISSSGRLTAVRNKYALRGNLIIPNTVTTIESQVFQDCSELTSVTIPHTVGTIGGAAFKNCSRLINIIILNGVTQIYEDAFAGCSSLTSITIPNSVTDIDYKAFARCSNLTSIAIGSGLTHFSEGVFDDCPRLKIITIDSANNHYCSENNNSIYTKDHRTLMLVAQGVTGSFIIPNNVTTIWSKAFQGCTGLESITIPDSVTRIGYRAFSYCTSLTNIIIPNRVTKIEGDTFSNCSELISITMQNSITSIGMRAFKDCTKLTNISIPSSGTSTIPSSETSVIENCAFQNCKSLTNITIPDSVTQIRSEAFSGCLSLTQISIPNSVTIIGYEAFYYCTGLTNITLGTGVTTIDVDAFRGCKNLTSIIIPNNVSKISNSAFKYCDKLKSVTFKDTGGWKATDGSFQRNIEPADLANTSKAAQYLCHTYCDHIWTKN